ncbi:LPD5 domain-containing protein [Halioglobus sp. HI00S01]|uniref:LPD5 domain-containing protein n=1 Tax=Halioglobus sp. HI00S01 TaxID=1822214 RepID=UPI0012E8E07D|nr:LPD5 domain-containing protein [Halioglobus sp. HI00S01]
MSGPNLDLKKLEDEVVAAPEKQSETNVSEAYFSRLTDILQSKLPGSGTGNQFAALLEKAPQKWGASKEEMDWLSLVDFARRHGQARIQKKDVIEWARLHQPSLSEVTLDGEDVRYDYVRPMHSAGKNYREILMTLPGLIEPSRSPAREEWSITEEARSGGLTAFVLEGPEGEEIKLSRGEASSEDDAWDIFQKKIVSGEVDLGNHPSYESPHWKASNVFLSLRISDLTAPDGRRMLFAEEVQSDWAQNRRKDADNIDPLPFERSWPMLAIKRLALEAAKGDYDGLAMSTGLQQSMLATDGAMAKSIKYNAFSQEVTITDVDGDVSFMIRSPEQLVDEFGTAGEIIKDRSEAAMVTIDAFEIVKDDMSGNYDVFDPSGSHCFNPSHPDGEYETRQEADDYIQTRLESMAAESPIVLDFDSMRKGSVENPMANAGLEYFYDKIVYPSALKYLRKVDPSIKSGDIEFFTGEPESVVPVIEISDKIKQSVVAGQPLFSLSASDALPTNTVPGVVDELVERFGETARALLDTGQLKVVQSESDLPSHLTPRDIGSAYPETLFYRGEHTLDISHPFETAEKGRLPTFTTDRDVASAYAVEPNNTSHAGTQPRVLMARLDASNPASLTDDDDPFVETERLVSLFGEDRTRKIVKAHIEHNGGTGINLDGDPLFDGLSDQSADDMLSEVMVKAPYFDSYQIADLAETADAAREAGYDAIQVYGAFQGDAILEVRVLDPSQVLDVAGRQFSMAAPAADIYTPQDLLSRNVGNAMSVGEYSDRQAIRSVYKHVLGHTPVSPQEEAVIQAVQPVIETWNGTPPNAILAQKVEKTDAEGPYPGGIKSALESVLVDAKAAASVDKEQPDVLGWDAPYSEQPETVQAALDQLGLNPSSFTEVDTDYTGGVSITSQLTGYVALESSDGSSLDVINPRGEIEETIPGVGPRASADAKRLLIELEYGPEGPLGSDLFRAASQRYGSPYLAAERLQRAGIGGIECGASMTPSTIVVFDDRSDLYDRSPRESRSVKPQARSIQGVHDGKISYLVADNISPGMAPGVLLHEVGEHAGMRDMLGDQYVELIQQFKRLLREEDAFACTADALVPTSTPAQNIDSERIAYLIELVENREQLAERLRGGSSYELINALPTIPSKRSRRVVDSALSKLRVWAFRNKGINALRKAIPGLPAIQLQPEDFVILARQSLDFVASHEAAAKPAPMFSMGTMDMFGEEFAPPSPGELMDRIIGIKDTLKGKDGEHEHRQSLNEILEAIELVEDSATTDQLDDFGRQLDRIERMAQTLPTLEEAEALREQAAEMERQRLEELKSNGNLSGQLSSITGAVSDSVDAAYALFIEDSGVDLSEVLKALNVEREDLNNQGIFDTDQLSKASPEPLKRDMLSSLLRETGRRIIGASPLSESPEGIASRMGVSIGNLPEDVSVSPPGAMGGDEVDAYWDQVERVSQTVVDQYAADGIVVLLSKGGLVSIIHPSAKLADGVQLTRYDHVGANDDTQHESLADAVREAVHDYSSRPLPRKVGETELQFVSSLGAVTIAKVAALAEAEMANNETLREFVLRVERDQEVFDGGMSGAGLRSAAAALAWSEKAQRETRSMRRILDSASREQGIDFLSNLVAECQGLTRFGWFEHASKIAEEMTEKLGLAPDATPDLLGNTGRVDDKIVDFGEKLHGARKDLYAFRHNLERGLPDENAKITKGTHFPEPRYVKLHEDGVSIETLALMATIRDGIPDKPRGGRRYELDQWREKFEDARARAIQLLDSDVSFDDVKSEIADLKSKARGADEPQANLALSQLEDLMLNAQTLVEMGFPEVKSLKKYKILTGEKTYINGCRFETPQECFQLAAKSGRRYRILGNFLDIDSARNALKEKLTVTDVAQRDRAKIKTELHYDDDRQVVIVHPVKNKKPFVLAGPFETAREAREYQKANEQDLAQKWMDIKNALIVRPTSNRERTGALRRESANVSPEQFEQTFQFRGVQFGKYVEQKKRQSDLNQAYDALMDLSAVMRCRPHELSLDGKLGLAFGARGRGGKNAAAAHYEPDGVIINLTKNSGAGSLAHEWWHALDNYLAKREGSTEYLSEFAAEGFSRNLPESTVDAFASLRSSITSTDLVKRSVMADGTREKDYWQTEREMSARSFERFVKDRLGEEGVVNDYLANFVSDNGRADYPYPNDEEARVINAAFDGVVDALEIARDPVLGSERKIESTGVNRIGKVGELILEHMEAAPKKASMSALVETGETPETIREALSDRFGDIVTSLEARGSLKIVADASDLPARASTFAISKDDLQCTWSVIGLGAEIAGSSQYQDSATGSAIEKPVWLQNAATGALRPFSVRSASLIVGRSPAELLSEAEELGPVTTSHALASDPGSAIDNIRALVPDMGDRIAVFKKDDRFIAAPSDSQGVAELLENGWEVHVDGFERAGARFSSEISNSNHRAGIQGYFDGRTAYLVANMLTPKTAPGVLLHEVSEHASFKAMLPDYNDLVTQYNRLLAENDPYVRLSAHLVPEGTPAPDVPSERLAYLVEIIENGADLPRKFRSDPELRSVVARLPLPRPGVLGLVDKVISNVKTHIYTSQFYHNNVKPILGSHALKLTAADISTLAHRALRGAAQGKFLSSNSGMSDAKYSFGGELSLNANMEQLNRAKEMHVDGESRTAIWHETGWFKDVDDHWKYEIDDSGAGIHMDNMVQTEEAFDREAKISYGDEASFRSLSVELQEDIRESIDPSYFGSGQPAALLDHPELLSSYPIRNSWLTVSIGPQHETLAGIMQPTTVPDGKNVRVNAADILVEANSKTLAVKGVLHELSHEVQDIEGWAPGGTPANAKRRALAAIVNKMAPLRKAACDYEEATRTLQIAMSVKEYAQLIEVSQSDKAEKYRTVVTRSPMYTRVKSKLDGTIDYPASRRIGQSALRELVKNAAVTVADATRRQFKQRELKEFDNLAQNRSSLSETVRSARSIERSTCTDASTYQELKAKHDGLRAISDERVYHNLAGEVEARNVERRANMSLEDRLMSPPFQTRDVAEDQIIVLPNRQRGQERFAKALVEMSNSLSEIVDRQGAVLGTESKQEVSVDAKKRMHATGALTGVNLARGTSPTESILEQVGFSTIPVDNLKQMDRMLARIVGQEAYDAAGGSPESFLNALRNRTASLDSIRMAQLDKAVNAILSDSGVGEHDPKLNRSITQVPIKSAVHTTQQRKSEKIETDDLREPDPKAMKTGFSP